MKLTNKITNHLSSVEKPRILVVGSKPDFTSAGLGRFDLALFANAAIGRESAFNCDFAYSVFAETIYLLREETKLAGIAWQVISAADPDHSVIIQGPGWTLLPWRAPAVPLACTPDEINLTQKRAVVSSVLGYPWIAQHIWQLAEGRRDFAKHLVKFVLRGQSSLMKPSTGLWCVLYACHIEKILGRECEIVVSGIGLSDDGYSYDKSQKNRLRGHDIEGYVHRVLLKKGIRFLDA